MWKETTTQQHLLRLRRDRRQPPNSICWDWDVKGDNHPTASAETETWQETTTQQHLLRLRRERRQPPNSICWDWDVTGDNHPTASAETETWKETTTQQHLLRLRRDRRQPPNSICWDWDVKGDNHPTASAETEMWWQTAGLILLPHKERESWKTRRVGGRESVRVCVRVCVCKSLSQGERGRQRERRVYAWVCMFGWGRESVCVCVCARVHTIMCVSVESSDRRKRPSLTKKLRRVSEFMHHWTEDSSNKLQTKTCSKVGLDCCEMGLLSPDRQRQSSVLSPVEGGCWLPLQPVIGNQLQFAVHGYQQSVTLDLPHCHLPQTATTSTVEPPDHTPSLAFQHLPPNSARFGYATEGALFISALLSTDTVSALRKVWVLIWLWKQPSPQALM